MLYTKYWELAFKKGINEIGNNGVNNMHMNVSCWIWFDISFMEYSVDLECEQILMYMTWGVNMQ